jgi:hypothetical protein
MKFVSKRQISLNIILGMFPFVGYARAYVGIVQFLIYVFQYLCKYCDQYA